MKQQCLIGTLRRIILVLVIITNLHFSFQTEKLAFLENSNNKLNVEDNNNIQDEEDLINISEYEYPKPESNETTEKTGEYTIAILGTTDIHGNLIKRNYYHPSTKVKYTKGGFDFFAYEMAILKETWGERMIWIDSGDEFQGGVETKVSKGQILTDFFNIKKLSAATVGNHEFDFGQDYLQRRFRNSDFPYISANIINSKNNQPSFWSNLHTNKIIKVGKVKVGFVGSTTILTSISTSGDLSDIKFVDYLPCIIKESNKLKEKGADAIVLIAHIGTKCVTTDSYTNKLRYYKDTEECVSSDNEMNILINKLKEVEQNEDTIYIDAIFAGHTHYNNHQFIQGKPIVSTVNNGRYFNVMYLTFNFSGIKNEKISSNENNTNYSNITSDLASISVDNWLKNTVIDSKSVIEKSDSINSFKSKSFIDSSSRLIREKTVIEGPIPICEKVFSNIKLCDNIDDNDSTIGELKFFKFHGVKVVSDEIARIVLSKWNKELQPYNEVLAETQIKLSRPSFDNGQTGNIFADCLKNSLNADFAVNNSHGFRNEWPAGDITTARYFDMFPFENYVVTFTITGEKVKRLFKTIEEGNKAPYSISGLQVLANYTINDDKTKKINVSEVRIDKNTIIEDNKIYKIASIDFLISNYGDNFSLVKEWLQPDNYTILKNDYFYYQQCLKDLKIITKETSSEKRIILNEIKN